METVRANGTAGKQEDAKTSVSPKKEAEEGKKATSPSRGEKEAIKNNNSASPSLETGQIKNSIYSGGEWKRPIIQFVESADEKRSTYFNVDAGEAKKATYPAVQLGEARRPQISFPERGDLRKPMFTVETKKPFASDGDAKKLLFSSGQIADLRKPTISISLSEPGDTKRGNLIRASRMSNSRPRLNLEEVLCDSCIDNKQKAVKSCLVCQASFCELHLKPHLEGAAFRDHQLLDPIKDFEARKCPIHGKTMELFCQTDQVCICYLCMFQEHKNHTTVTVEIEKSGKETDPLGSACSRASDPARSGTFPYWNDKILYGAFQNVMAALIPRDWDQGTLSHWWRSKEEFIACTE
ncbi:UNVERIFIED_CONTAM: hypothetical protein K2H54_012864 [Gekko kuhli]